jgi:hypothetical protein
MEPIRDIEEAIRKKLHVTAGSTLHDRVLARIRHAQEQYDQTTPAPTEPVARRTIMKSPIAKLATAAAVIVAIMIGIYALTGSGTSITMAQVRQAMQNIDWMQLNNKIPEKEGTQWIWFSFASRVEIVCDPEGRITYSNFNTGKKLVWNPGSQGVYESAIDQRRQFVGDFGGPFEFITKLFGFLTAEKDWKVTKELGTYQGKKVEVWSATRVREKADSTRTETTTVYIDIEKKLPVAWQEGVKGPDGSIQLLRDGEFKYPETGPADIYDAGAPRSAQIKSSPEQ